MGRGEQHHAAAGLGGGGQRRSDGGRVVADAVALGAVRQHIEDGATARGLGSIVGFQLPRRIQARVDAAGLVVAALNLLAPTNAGLHGS